MATRSGPPHRGKLAILAMGAAIFILICFAAGYSRPPGPPASEPGGPAGRDPEPGTTTGEPVERPGQLDLAALGARDLAERLSFLSSPIAGARVATADSLLPVAPREYRNGIHQGLDYYPGYCGVTIAPGTPVLAAADGYVLRADHAYAELSEAERAALLRETQAASQTPEPILDRLRGRQVWLSHGDGVITRYAHLGSIPPDLPVGARVQSGQVIGFVGNSGTSAGAKGTGEGAHLHFEIWVNGEPFWAYLDREEIRQVLEAILND